MRAFLAARVLSPVMALFHPKFLEVSVPWVMRHDWPRRQRYHSPPNPMHTLWLVSEGHVEVRIGEREYSVAAGMAFLTPPGQQRTITTPGGARWTSICLGAT